MNLQEFVEHANLIHNYKYNYELIKFNSLLSIIEIICPIHGSFKLRAKYHIYQKRGCRKCICNPADKYSKIKENFINNANNIHNNKYDYSLVDYKGSNIKVEIICPIHGIFKQTPSSHIQNHGCKECDTDRKRNNLRLSHEEVIRRFKEIHGDLYDYSKVNYISCFDNITVTCKLHGDFTTTYSKHYLAGSGCYLCNGGVSLTTKEVVRRFTSVHNNIYDYSKFNYINAKTKGEIICLKHGSFFQNYIDHYHNSHGCPKCANNYSPNNNEILLLCNELHNNKYDYSLVEYNGAHSNIEIICPTHGIFTQTPSNHIHNKNGCPKCSSHVSNTQREIYEYIFQYNQDTILEDRTTYPNLYLDITIPSKQLAIEYNGIYWHTINDSNISSRYKLNNHLKDKLLLAKKYGLRVINIYEDEWIDNQLQIKQIINNALGIIKGKIGARKCFVWSCISSDPNFITHIQPFFNKYHHQGLRFKPNGVAYCLIYNMQIVACAYFGQNNYHNQNECELIRYTTKAGYKVQGGLSKLIKAFISNNSWVKNIISYCDARLFTGEGYIKSGFKLIDWTSPGFDVIVNGKRKHRSCIVKNKLKNYFSNEDLNNHTQFELAEILGWRIIPDCGQLVFLFTL